MQRRNMPVPHVLLVDRVKRDLFEWEIDFDEAFGGSHRAKPSVCLLKKVFQFPGEFFGVFKILNYAPNRYIRWASMSDIVP